MFEALSSSKCAEVNAQARKMIKFVHSIICRLGMIGYASMFGIVMYAMPNENSSQEITAAIAMVIMVLVSMLESIHGLPVQSAGCEFVDEFCGNIWDLDLTGLN